jgi:hypothetical protein
MKMASPCKQLGQGAGGASYSTIYTVGAGLIGWLKDLQICNTTGAPVAAYVHIVPSGGSAQTSNAIVYGYSIPANGFMPLTSLNQFMPAGATLQIKGTGLTYTASGLEVAA